MLKTVNQFTPSVVILDPINTFVAAGNEAEVKVMLMRLVDFLKSKGITALFTSLTTGGGVLEHTDVAISSLIDTWLLLRDIEIGGERNRGLYILKSRGMAHSNQIREFLLTDHGVELADVYVGPGGVLTGSARQAQEAQEEAERLLRQQEIERRQRDLERKRQALEAQIAALRVAFEAEEAELQQIVRQEQVREARLVQDRRGMATSRHADK
jgi:circadian clock protein KaiC